MSISAIHTFAIGDVHGRADLLEALLAGIANRARDLTYRVIFLGDIIDRGPQSRQALDLVVETTRNVPGSKLILGNHDSFILRIVDEPSPAQKQALLLHWVHNLGGASTLQSYGANPASLYASMIGDVVPQTHIDALRSAEKYVELDGHILVHAGLEPGVPLEKQDPHKLMWIRDQFLDCQKSFGKIVVHGHTPTVSGRVEQYANRIAVDTNAHASNLMSALHIDPAGPLSVIEAMGIGQDIKLLDELPMDMTEESFFRSAPRGR